MIVGLWLGGNPLGLGCSRIPSGLDLDGIGDRPSERLRLDVGLRDIVFNQDSTSRYGIVKQETMCTPLWVLFTKNTFCSDRDVRG